MKNKIIMLAVLLLISMSTASAFVFEKPRDDVFFEKNGNDFSVTYKGEFIYITVHNVGDYTDCLWVYNNFTYYELLKKFSTRLNEDTKSINVDEVDILK